MAKEVEVEIPVDFSVGAVNYMLELGRKNGFGPCKGIYSNPIENNFHMGKELQLYDWGLVFEGGDVVASRA